ncbi:MAG: SDR family oxidoreductase [Microcella sp.]|uniref:SDR family oxidoreductase n=1 Tax=Microcella sp. TaxID=1913979 RepID=UPI0024C696D0|nr:SDR family oxidoreductase [Microcella sp.]UYN84413.1 MAG: SDR family oxidoreductase [Microcella sp.]
MNAQTHDPTTLHRAEEFPAQSQDAPGLAEEMTPTPDHGEDSYKGHGRLLGRRALITGGDSGIGRAVAIAFAREGADVAFTHLPEEHADAAVTEHEVRDAGRTAVAMEGDLRDEQFAERIVDQAVGELGGLDILVLNAARQGDRSSVHDVTADELRHTFETNLFSQIATVRAALPHLNPGASVILTTSIQAFDPSPGLLDYAMTKAAQVAFVRAMANDWGSLGVRVNGVAPGPIWTPLIPSTGWDDEKVSSFGQDTPLGRAGQPAELAGAYVYLASEEATYVSGTIIGVTGGRHL